MKWLMIGFSLAVLFVALPAMAEKPETTVAEFKTAISPGELTPTPEMWFYEEELRRYEDPKLAVRRKAEVRAATRMHRLTAMKWFGMSNQRPKAGVDPQHSDYAPFWTGNNRQYPFRWMGRGRGAGSVTIVRPARSTDH